MAGAEAGAELSKPHLDGFAVLALARGLGFGQRLRFIWRVRRTKTVFREIVRCRGATQIRFVCVLFELAEKKIARGDVGVNFRDSRTIHSRTGRGSLERFLENHGRSVERKSLSHSDFQAGPVLESRLRKNFRTRVASRAVSKPKQRNPADGTPADFTRPPRKLEIAGG